MTKEVKDHLFLLIKSLTKSEKRQFKLFVGRLDINQDSKFLHLFNFLDKAKTYDEAAILNNGIIKKQQLANVKAHLYKQILISLKLNPSHQNVRLQIREQLDFASILYHKGLYKQSLRILDKSKEFAIKNEEKNLAYEIVELEKIIESQYITRSISNRAEDLTRQAEELSTLNITASKLSNLSLQLYGIILKSGYVKNESERNEITTFFEDRLPKYDFKLLGFREKLWLYNAHLWFSFLLQDFKNCYRFASKWVNLFYEYPRMISLNPVFFLKGNNYLLESIFFLRKKERFIEAYTNLKGQLESSSFPTNENIKILSFIYLNTHSINMHFIDGSFNQGIDKIPKIEEELRHLSSKIDTHYKMVLYYKFACLHFGAGNNRECIRYLQKIISTKSLKAREDLMCFARILNLVAHYEAGLDFHLDSLLKSTYRFLIKMNDLHEVQKEMIKFIKGLQDIYPGQVKAAFSELHQRLKQYEDHPFERRAFLYLDIISWLESKIENVPVGVIFKRKFLEQSRGTLKDR
ncbi:hypothetical protein [Winogradskyella aurantiaca]|uniref:hypothetical protein n=1 Tax=Winogradskyella aurantiaca TaxID=2219558 RepID=UPI000E1DC21C|nr:hypothetical protein [Winogradskyella aurantiaca]